MDSIKVAIKVRPLIKREKDDNLPIQWIVNDNSIAPLDPEQKKRGEPFYFDHIFDTSQNNYDVFRVIAKPIVDAAINGINGTIFAYGQTSSGKTFTMMGEEDSPGVIPLSIDYIFDKITSTYDREFLLRVSYIEIYNEKVNDLLDKNGIDLKIKEEKSGQAIVTCREEVVNCSEVVLGIMRKGLKNRRIGETNMNERSSRSHTIFRITIESRELDSDGAVNVSQLNLVDLAGSERPKQSGATGDRFNEGRHINLSLSALGLVILQLSEAQENPQRHVNFRDSKLTRILQTSLGGNAMTTIICAVTPAASEETQCTLAFASRAKCIKNKPQVNECLSEAALLKRYVKQLAKLKNELEKAQCANLVEMESKLEEKDRANQLLVERIELLKTRIVSGNNTPEDEKARRRSKRRRTWGGPGTFPTKIPPFQITGGLPTIKELERTPEKKIKQENIKRRQSIIQSLDIPNQTFQTEFTDFELELIESERSRCRLSDGSLGSDEGLFFQTRSQRNVQFRDDVTIMDDEPRSCEITPEKKTSESTSSPETPKAVLRSRINFLMEQYNALTKDHRSLEEFTQLEKQMFVDEAVEAAMVEHNKTVETLRLALADSERTSEELLEKYTKLQSHSSETDKRLDDLKRQFAESENSLMRLKNEKEILVNELNKFKQSKTVTELQASGNITIEKETSSIFANNTYFDEMNDSDNQCDSVFTNDTQNTESPSICDKSVVNDTIINKMDDSKRSKDIINATYSEFMRQIGEKSNDELARVMQDLFNTKISLEEENIRLEATLRQKVRESEDVKNDIRELKSGIEKLQETIHLLTSENTDLTSKLTNEKENAREAEKSLQCTIADLSSRIETVAQEKIAMENTVRELDERLKPTSAQDEKTINLLNEYRKTIESLTAENIELSSNLMNKIEESDRPKDVEALPGDHECAYRELMINLSKRNELLESENIELSNNLMDKIEEYERLRELHEIARCKLSIPSPQKESNNLVDISMNITNLLGDDVSSTFETGRTTIKTDEEGVAREKNEIKSVGMKFTGSTVDDLLRMSLPARSSILDKVQKTNDETIDDLSRMSIIPGETINENVGALKLKAETLREQVDALTLLNEKLRDLKTTTSCKQCSHLVELRDNRKLLQNEVKLLDRTLEELQMKFDREFADTEILRTKASENLDLSVCDTSFNGSTNLEGAINVSYVEERVQSLHNEIETLRARHEKLSNLYRDKCDEIEKLHDSSSRESTTTVTCIDSPRLRRDDSRLERIQTDMEKSQNDLRHLKKSIGGVSSSLQKFINDKTTMESEIEALKSEKRGYEEKLMEAAEITSLTEKKCESLEDKVARLSSEIANYEISKEQTENEKTSLETEIQSLKREKQDLEEKITKEMESSSMAREKIESLANEAARLSLEMKNYDIVREELENALLSLESEIESLKAKREEEKRIASEFLTTKVEKIETLEREVARLVTEIDDSNIVKRQLEDSRTSLEAQVELLKIERENFDEILAKNEKISEEKIQSLENQVSRLSTEIENSNETKRELEDAKSLLQGKVQSLKNENEALAIKLTESEISSEAREKIELLENEVSRLISEIENANVVQGQLKDAKSSLSTEVDSLRAEQIVRDEIIKELQSSLEKLEENNRILKSTLERIDSEKNQSIVEQSAILSELKLQEATNDLERFVEINAEQNVRFEQLKTTEDKLIALNSNLQEKIDDLLAEKTNIEANRTNFSEILSQMQKENSTLTTNTETLGNKLEQAINDLNERTKENVELKEKFYDHERFEKEWSDEKSILMDEITTLRDELTNIRDSTNSLRETIQKLEENNSSLTLELEKSKISNDKQNETKFDATSYKTLKEYEKMVDELREKLQEITEELQSNTKETIDMRVELTKLKESREESNDMRLALEAKVENLKIEKNELLVSLTNLQKTLSELDEKNVLLNEELRAIKEERVKIVCSESFENFNSQNYEKTIESLNIRLEELNEKLVIYSTENDELRAKIVHLQDTICESMKIVDRKIDLEPEIEKCVSTKENTFTILSYENNLEELESAKKSIRKEIMSLKPSADSKKLEEKSTSELFGFFVTTIMSKEREIIKALTDDFEREKRKLEESKKQSIDAEKRANVWVNELEAEIERTQQDLIRQETKNTELCRKISDLENLLKESNHENQMLNDKMKVLEADFDTLEIDLDKSPESHRSSALSSNQEKERFIRESSDTREMELSSKLRLAEKQYREKLEELTVNLEYQKTRNIDLSNSLEGLEANERQLRNIVDMRTNEVAKCNATIERLQIELNVMTESYSQSSCDNAKKAQQIDEITNLLKAKCDKLSEYKTKLENITPEYEILKDQANERQLRLEKYKSEIECLTTMSEKNISSLKDRLDTEEIKSLGYQKQLAELTSRNATLQLELAELRTKCDELEISNGKLAKSMRNSTSKIRAEVEMEDLRDRNRILERNFEGAGNRINELQDVKTRLMNDLVDLRVQHDITRAENEELKNVLSSHRSTVADTIELREKYDSLLLEKNRIDMELADKRSRFAQMEKRIETLEGENETLRLNNNELDAEMDDIVKRISELTKENGELDDKLYSSQNVIADLEAKIAELTKINLDLETRVKTHIDEIELSKIRNDKLRGESDIAATTSETLVNENSELRTKLSQLDRGDTLNCGDSERSSSPAIETIRIDNRRRRSRNELFNMNRPLEVFETNEESENCRCEALKQHFSKLEKDLALKDAKIATLELKIQSEIFPHMRRCKDLEEILATETRKNKLLKSEMRKLEEKRAKEMSSECERCKQWRMNKRDQASQCMPDSTPIYMSGMSSGIIDGHVKVIKLEKDKNTLKALCRSRQKRIFELENRIKELENFSSTQVTSNEENSTTTDSASHGTSSKPDSASTFRQAMKENVPVIWDSKRQPSHLRRDWFN